MSDRVHCNVFNLNKLLHVHTIDVGIYRLFAQDDVVAYLR